MLLEWKGLCMLALPDHRVGKNYTLARSIICSPGVNIVEDEVWEVAKTNASIISHINNNELVVIREKTPTGAAVKKGEAAELSGLTLEHAVAIVERTFNLEVLEGWADEETRNKVRRACEAQIQKLKITKKEQ